MRSPGENMSNVEVASKLLCLASGKVDSITTSIQKFHGLDSLTLDKVIRSLKVHEDKLKD